MRPLPLVTAALAVAQFAAGLAVSGDRGGHRWQFPDTYLTPAPPTFAIWGLIFIAGLGYGLYQLRPAARDRELVAATRPFAAAAFATCAAWLWVAESGFITATAPVHVLLYLAILGAFGELCRRETRGLGEVLVGFPLGLYAGWVSLTAAANLSSVAALWLPGAAVAVTQVALLVGAGALALGRLADSGGRLAYLVGLGWGLGGLVRGNLSRGTPVGAAIAAGLLLAALVVTARARRR